MVSLEASVALNITIALSVLFSNSVPTCDDSGRTMTAIRLFHT